MAAIDIKKSEPESGPVLPKDKVIETVKSSINSAASEILPAGITKDQLAKQLAKEVAMMLSEKNIPVKMEEELTEHLSPKLETIISRNGEVQITSAYLQEQPQEGHTAPAAEVDPFDLNGKTATQGQGPKPQQQTRVPDFS